MRRAEVWGITPDLWPPEATRQAIQDALADGIDRVIVRERRLPVATRHALLGSLLDAGLAADRVLLRIGPDDPAPPDGWSVHLADGVPPPPGARPLVSAAVHHTFLVPEHADWLVVSPFATPISKTGMSPPLGPRGLQPFLGTRPVVALGGITPMNAPRALAAGARAVASIGTVFLHGSGARRRLVAAVQAFPSREPG